MKNNPYHLNDSKCERNNTCPFKNKSSLLDTNENFCYICSSPLVDVPPPVPIFRKALPFLLGLLLVVFGYFVWQKIKPEPSSTELSPQLKDGEALKKIKEKGFLRVMVESDAAPFNWEENGKPTGFEFEIISLVAKKLGVNVKMIATADYDGIPEKIKAEQDSADIFMGGYVPNPDLNWVEWSNSYLNENGYCLIVREGSAISNIKDLKNSNKKVLIYKEEKARQFVKNEIPQAQVIEDEDADDRNWLIRHLVDTGDVDAAVYDYPFASQEVKDANELLAKEGKPKLKIVQFNLNVLAYAIGVPKDLKLLAAINTAIDEIVKSAEYPELVKKYLDFDRNSANIAPIPEGSKIHVVEAGETLSKIAESQLGNYMDWMKIWELNKDRIPNPNLVRVGDKLIMP